MDKVIDLRSDTVTVPTPAMRRAMAEAAVGDDVYGEDPTVNELERLAAAKVGKEAALFVPSGTMANQIGVMLHAGPGEEVLVEAEAHIYYYEQGGIGALAGAQPRPIPTPDGRLTPELLAAALRPKNIHFPRTKLLCLENTHNRSGGRVLSVEATRSLAELAHRRGLAVHLDGARIFNASVALGVPVTELTGPADTVAFCLSKGLAAPVGSLLAGPSDLIERARWHRKRLGGGMRQAGILAAAGILALTEMVDRLAEDHANARYLAEGLNALGGYRVDLDSVETNMVVCHLTGSRRDAAAEVERWREAGILVNAIGPSTLRLVTHKDVDRADVEEALGRLERLA